MRALSAVLRPLVPDSAAQWQHLRPVALDFRCSGRRLNGAQVSMARFRFAMVGGPNELNLAPTELSFARR